MLRYKTETRSGLVTLYDIRPGNRAGQFLQPRSPHGRHCSHKYSQLPSAIIHNLFISSLKYLGNLQCIQIESPYFPILECIVENFKQTKQPDTR